MIKDGGESSVLVTSKISLHSHSTLKNGNCKCTTDVVFALSNIGPNWPGHTPEPSLSPASQVHRVMHFVGVTQLLSSLSVCFEESLSFRDAISGSMSCHDKNTIDWMA